MKLIDLLVKELPKRGGWPEGVEAMAQDADGAVQNYSDTIDIIINDELAHGNSRIALSYSIDSGECGIATDRLTAIITRAQYEAALAKNDGWIEWGGGECPVDEGEIVDLKDRDGYLWLGADALFSTEARAEFWRHTGGQERSSDIIAYRLHKPDINSRANDDRLEQDLKEIEVSGKYLDDIMNIPVRIDRLEQDLNECIGASEAQVWGGVGLPPVGCDVEYDSFPYGWSVINIVARIEGATFIEWKSGQFKGADIIRGEFPIERCRPLRTEAERKREEAIQDLTSVICGSVPDTGMATAAMYAEMVYDAGYRKENK